VCDVAPRHSGEGGEVREGDAGGDGVEGIGEGGEDEVRRWGGGWLGGGGVEG